MKKLLALFFVASGALGQAGTGQFNILNYGASPNLIQLSDGNISSGSLSTLNSASGRFTSGMVGQTIVITGANGSGPLKTTIAGYTTATAVTLTSPAANAVTNAVVSVGLDNSSAINSAMIAASSAGGGTVLVPPGSYLCAETLLIPSNVTLTGTNQTASVILNPFSTSPTGTGMITNTNYSTSNVAPINFALDHGITISNITLDGQNPIIGSPVNGVYYGIAMYGVTGLNIQGVTVRGTEGQGIIANYSTKVQIIGNTLPECGLDCIQMQDTTNFAVDKNIVGASGDFDIEINSGQWATSASAGYGSVTNNVLQGASTVGIGLRGDGASTNPGSLPLTQVSVIGNTVFAPRLAQAGGISFYGAVTNSAVTGNTITGSGVGLSTSAEYYGGNTLITSNVTIGNNTVTGNGVGMLLASTWKSSIVGNIVTGNATQGLITTGGYLTFTANHFDDNNTALANEVVSSLLFSGGTGYPASFNVVCSGGGSGAQAVVALSSTSGVPSYAQLNSPGYGFSSAPTCQPPLGTPGAGATFTPVLSSAAIVLDNAYNLRFSDNSIFSTASNYIYALLETGYSAGSALQYNDHDLPYSTQGHSTYTLDYSITCQKGGTNC